MDWNFKKMGPAVALTMVGLASTGFAAAPKNASAPCPQDMPAPCYTIDTPACDYCLGPENVAGNPAVRPKTCNGDAVITIAGFYWNARQDGMEYAIFNSVAPPTGADSTTLNNIIEARYLNPKSKWNFGFKFGLGYNSNHDGWDFDVLWTRYHGRSSTRVDGDTQDNTSLIPLWSDFASSVASPVLFATDMQTHWRLKLDLVDIEMGREFWSSKYLTLRPFIGLRVSWIKQNYEIDQQGGSWGSGLSAFNGEVQMDNDFKGIGVRGGLDSNWLIGRGFSFFGNVALAIVYGRFSIDHEEFNRQASAPFAKTPLLDSDESFHASRGMTDLELGIEWSTMFSNCNYGFTVGLSWEHHMFFNQNQLWRVNRIFDSVQTPPNNSGENTFIQRRGDLSTQGWTLTATFDF